MMQLGNSEAGIWAWSVWRPSLCFVHCVCTSPNEGLPWPDMCLCGTAMAPSVFLWVARWLELYVKRSQFSSGRVKGGPCGACNLWIRALSCLPWLNSAGKMQLSKALPEAEGRKLGYWCLVEPITISEGEVGLYVDRVGTMLEPLPCSQLQKRSHRHSFQGCRSPESRSWERCHWSPPQPSILSLCHLRSESSIDIPWAT